MNIMRHHLPFAEVLLYIASSPCVFMDVANTFLINFDHRFCR